MSKLMMFHRGGTCDARRSESVAPCYNFLQIVQRNQRTEFVGNAGKPGTRPRAIAI